MKIVRHTARDMRQALRGVREQLGEDAVILSSRRVAGGVEVTAAVDFDTSSPNARAMAEAATAAPVLAPASQETPPAAIVATLAPTPTPAPRVAAAPAPRVAAAPAPRVAAAPAQTAAPVAQVAAAPARPFAHILADEAAKTDLPLYRGEEPAPAVEQASAHDAAVTAPRDASVTAHDATVTMPHDATVTEVETACLAPFGRSDESPADTSAAATSSMGTELKTLRRILETQLAQLAWNDLTRRAPIHTEILRELSEIGINQEISEYIVKQLPNDVDLTFARRFAIAGLSQYLLVTGDRWLDTGGRLAFVGATGVGKTTTLAKVAVRWVLRHGSRDIALVGADSVRIGAQDQLQALGQLLGVPVYLPDQLGSLPNLLSRSNERLILIDTPGAGSRDPQLSQRLSVLAEPAMKVETTIVLSANTQAGALEDTVARFGAAKPASCVLTKIDEAASLGGLLSVLIQARLPVSYLSEGQRVPEDLRPARALELVSAAVRLAKASGAAADEDLLRRRFGKTAHAFT